MRPQSQDQSTDGSVRDGLKQRWFGSAHQILDKKKNIEEHQLLFKNTHENINYSSVGGFPMSKIINSQQQLRGSRRITHFTFRG